MPGPGRKPKKKGRARKGTGSIYWSEKHQCYVGQISLGTDSNGKRIRPTFYGKTVEEVQRQIDERTCCSVSTCRRNESLSSSILRTGCGQSGRPTRLPPRSANTGRWSRTTLSHASVGSHCVSWTTCASMPSTSCWRTRG